MIGQTRANLLTKFALQICHARICHAKYSDYLLLRLSDMSYCLRSSCPSPHNPSTARYCQACGSALLLGDRYRVLRPIGEGGFGRTFLATDCINRQPCVIKHSQLPNHQPSTIQSSNHQPSNPTSSEAISPSQQNIASYLERFRQEAQRLSELGHHPQIPQLLDVIEQLPDLYLIQEFIAGQTLADEVQESGPFDEQQVRSLLTDLLPVLQFIHGQRIIHRDIKPQNIIRPEQGGPLVLVDFGAAKQTSRAMMARTGTVIGSAGYAAPEQTMGKAVFASDLYSLGVTCIHALTGMHPFDLFSVGQDEWVWSQYLLSPVSPALETLLNTLLRRPVNQRYRTANAVLTDLNASPSIPPPSSKSVTPSRSTSSSLLNRLKQTFGPSPSNTAASPAWLAFERSTPRSPSEKATHLNDSATPTTSLPPSVTSAASPNALPAPQRPPAPVPSTWTLSQTLSHHTHGVTALAISPDSMLLASGDRHGTILLWNLASATRLHEFPTASVWQRLGGRQVGHRDRITALQFTADSTFLISSSADGSIKQWDVGQRRLHATLMGEGWVLSTLLLHPEGELLLSGGANGAIDLWDLSRNQFIQRLWTQTDEISGLVLTSDGANLFSSSYDGTIHHWDMRTAESIASFRAHLDGVSALALHPHHPLLISGGGDRTLRLWDIHQRTLRHTMPVDTDMVSAIALHPSGALMANTHDDTHIQLWRLDSEPSSNAEPVPHRRPQALIQMSQDWTITALVFSPGGDRFVSSSADGTIKIWRSKS